MFDPLAYIKVVENGLATWTERGAEVNGPIVTFADDEYLHRWDEFYWRCSVVFPAGQRFIASESHLLGLKKIHLRKISYRLMEADGTRIFQVDTHLTPIPYEDPPHLHLGPDAPRLSKQNDPRIYEDNSRLKGISLRKFDFVRMWEWVDAYINENGRMPC